MIKSFLIIPEGMIRIKHANTLGHVYFIIPEGVIKSLLIIPEGMIRIKYANTLGKRVFYHPRAKFFFTRVFFTKVSLHEGLSSQRFPFTKVFLPKVFPFRVSIYNSVPSYNHYGTFEIVWII